MLANYYKFRTHENTISSVIFIPTILSQYGKKSINKSSSILFSNVKARCAFNSTHCQGMCTDIFYFSVKEHVPTHFSVKKCISLWKNKWHWYSFPNRCIYYLKKGCFNLLFVTGSQFRRSSTKKLETLFVLARKLLFWTAIGAGAELLRSKPPVNNTKEQICMTLALTPSDMKTTKCVSLLLDTYKNNDNYLW